MNKIISIILIALTSTHSFAIPPAGAPSLAEILPTQKAYVEAMSQLNPTGEASIEFFDKYNLPDSLKTGNCQQVLLSRSGVMVKVAVPVSDGEAILYFGDIDGDPAYPVRCQ